MRKQLLFFITVMVFTACDATRHLAENEQLYAGAEVLVESEVLSKSEKKQIEVFAEGLIRPRPNSSALGIPYKLLVYQATQPRELTTGRDWLAGVKKWLQNEYGEAPVLYSRVDPSFASRLIQNELDNKGYFRAQVVSDTLQKDKKVQVNYVVRPGRVYRIGEVQFPDTKNAQAEANPSTNSTLAEANLHLKSTLTADNPSAKNTLAAAIQATQESSLLQPGLPYNLERIKSERLRIDELLKEQGFYYFNPDHLLVQADSTAGDYRVNLKLIIKPETPRLAYEQFFVRNIKIDPPQDFRPGILEEMLSFQRNSLYNRTNHNLALHRLVSMGNFQFVRNRFVVADTTGNYLDAIYNLTPFPTKSLKAELSARTNSANYSGTALTGNWSHRNAFRGAELLNISLFGSLDFQMGQGTGYHLYRTGVEASLVWPRLVAPFAATPTGKFIPKTRAALGYELQHRAQLYTKHQFNGSFGYQWKSSPRAEHRLMLTEITYANPAYVSEYYKSLMRTDPGLIKSVEEELILGPSYSFEFTNTMQEQRTHRFYSRSSVQTSAVLLGLLTGVSPQQSTPKTFLGVPFSQFLRFEQEYRHYNRLHPSVELAGRILAGAGLPYGNSVALPYARQFFIGGSSSLRAFPARSVGPGTFRSPVSGGGFLADESGDLKLELNAELRAKLFSFVHGALFVDAGNVWLLNESPLKPGGQISRDFLNELAVGTGAGIRLDFTMIVVRVDLAVPLHKPWLPAGNRWVGSESDFGTSTWWKANRMWNVAIGYPF